MSILHTNRFGAENLGCEGDAVTNVVALPVNHMTIPVKLLPLLEREDEALAVEALALVLLISLDGQRRKSRQSLVMAVGNGVSLEKGRREILPRTGPLRNWNHREVAALYKNGLAGLSDRTNRICRAFSADGAREGNIGLRHREHGLPVAKLEAASREARSGRGDRNEGQTGEKEETRRHVVAERRVVRWESGLCDELA